MGEPGREQRVREEATWRRATFLELFFDLVFVFALNQVSMRLINDFTTGHRLLFSEAAPTFLLFLALWMLWVSTVVLTSRVDPNSWPGQIAVFMTMAGGVVMAVAVAQGFEQRALVFAAAYVAARISRQLLNAIVRPAQRAPIPLKVSIVVGAVPWIVGALVDDLLLRAVLWALALALEYGGFALGLGRTVGVPVAGEHLAERLQQFFLITLGEAVFVSGKALSDSDFGIPHAAGFGLAFVSIVLLWRIYFYRAGAALPLAITRARNPDRQSVAVAGSHLLMIAGVVLAAVGFELDIIEPHGRPEPQWLIAILGGPALFLAGRALIELQVFSRVSRSRLAGLFTLGLLIPATWYAPPLTTGAAAATVLAAIAVWDAWRARGRELEPPAPRI
ncbi:low temperature requirement protein A [Micromonospora sp. 4G57]|uniref:Low temperature requirement protein A n=1 Tax=Micromonospora sicca TaxID=2202420 RepID=A0ABU5JC34_9ACTN|nr:MULTISPECIES: low temperature requirement protein A [unclassified Micromonospora]MDZ5446609.1 low temperature requirement protein A [Micromonospora sp. 4G57]MDZ5490130.1 low temperature requirement protein A [Micromonospora sp. 4G53]